MPAEGGSEPAAVAGRPLRGLPSWRRETKPESRWPVFAAGVLAIAAMFFARAINIATG